MFGLQKMSALRRWTVFFSIFDILLLATGVIVSVTAFMWKSLLAAPPAPNDDIFLRLAVTEAIVDSGLLFSIAVFITVIISVWPLTTRPTSEDAATSGLLGFMAILLNTTVITMGIATAIWLSTLREKTRFLPVWVAQTTEIQTFVQEQLKCCGWFNATAQGLFTSTLQTGFCANPASLPVDPDPNVSIGCEQPFIDKVDIILRVIFTTTYGFVALEVVLVLIAATVLKLRLHEKRFLRIDLKDLKGGGKGGFV